MVEHLIKIISLATEEGCDPSVEDCVTEEAVKFPEYSGSDFNKFAAISFANALLPALYYSLSYDY